MELEYRVLELTIEQEDIITKPFDFGCTAIVQDNIKALEQNKELQENPGKFALQLVEMVLHRMLEGKILNFNIVKTLSPETVHILFLKFQSWFKQDMEYLSTLMSQNEGHNLVNGSDNTNENNDSLYYVQYMLFKHHNIDPERILEWKFETVATILFMSERERIQEAKKPKK